jgi:hypothetical protein
MQQYAHEAYERLFVGEDLHNIGAPLDLTVQPLDWVRGADLAPMAFREGHVGQHIVGCLVHQGGDAQEALAQAIGDTAPFFVRLFFLFLNEGGADGCGNHAALLDVHAGHGVAHIG